jgi:tRNA modification GTPase
LDDGIAIVFRGPSSFTGEDTVEITCHGGVLVTECVLAAAFAAGARPAEAGEFTRRAFLSGKMDLSGAEALGDLLEASTYQQVLVAGNGMRGGLAGAIRTQYEVLRRVLSTLYAGIDFPDEDLGEMSREEMQTSLEQVRTALTRLASTYRTGRAVHEGIRTVICGQPNTGKSTLYNRLVGREAAIVTDVAGTTRDVLTETASLGGVTLRLADTAGLRESGDLVEQIGVERSGKEMEQAELVLAVLDGSRPCDETDRAFADRLRTLPGRVLVLLNKTDRRLASYDLSAFGGFEVLEISAREGHGMEALERRVAELFLDGSLDLQNDAIVTGARQYGALQQADGWLAGALADLAAGQELDLCCAGVERAMEALGEIDGRSVSEELVGEIFSHFCVGK